MLRTVTAQHAEHYLLKRHSTAMGADVQCSGGGSLSPLAYFRVSLQKVVVEV